MWLAKIRAVEASLRQWDPIGVRPREMAPADEYDSYAPHIVSLVEKACTVAELAAHLRDLRVKSMVCFENHEADRTTAARIIDELRQG
jgi:hypothetical protein